MNPENREMYRMKCLELAVANATEHDSASDIVAFAEAFFAFMEGDKA